MLVDVFLIFIIRVSRLNRDLAPDQTIKSRNVENLKKLQKLLKDLTIEFSAAPTVNSKALPSNNQRPIKYVLHTKKPTCASKRDVLELAILRYFKDRFGGRQKKSE